MRDFTRQSQNDNPQVWPLNMIKAVSLSTFGWHRIPCAAHTLQLSVRAGLDLPGVALLTAKCRKLVGHFRHSAQATAKLKHVQKALKMKEVKLKQEVATRWSSTYDMIQRLIKLKAPVSRVKNRQCRQWREEFVCQPLPCHRSACFLKLGP